MKIFFTWKQKKIKQGHVTTAPASQVNHSRKQSSWIDTEHLEAEGKNGKASNVS